MNLLRIISIGCWLAVTSGCATQPPPPADPFAALEAFDVKFVHQPPSDAKFIAKIPVAVGYSDHWQVDCIRSLRTQAVKLGGNLVVPGTELDWGTHKLYTDDGNLLHPPPGGVRLYNSHPGTSNRGFAAGKFHFWSNIYYVPE